MRLGLGCCVVVVVCDVDFERKVGQVSKGINTALTVCVYRQVAARKRYRRGENRQCLRVRRRFRSVFLAGPDKEYFLTCPRIHSPHPESG